MTQKGHILRCTATHSNVKAAYGPWERDDAVKILRIIEVELMVGAQGIEPWTSPV
jgi:hypothetical protein